MIKEVVVTVEETWIFNSESPGLMIRVPSGWPVSVSKNRMVSFFAFKVM